MKPMQPCTERTTTGDSGRAVITRMSALIAATVVLACAMPAAAQNATGGGNVLDANLNALEGRYNPSTAGSDPLDFRLRNLLVTGNVAGGRGFREAVGYSAPGDFRGQLGSDDLFSFRAASAFTAPSFLTDTSRLGQLRFGRELGLIEYQRSFTGTTPSALDPEGIGQVRADIIGTQLRLDDFAAGSSLSRSPEIEVQPQPIGITTYEDQAVMISASGLMGMDARLMQEEVALAGLSTLDRLRLVEDVQRGDLTAIPGREFEVDFRRMLAEQFGVEVPDDRQVPDAIDDGMAAEDDDPLIATTDDGRIGDDERDDTRIDTRLDRNRLATMTLARPYEEILEEVARRYAGPDEPTDEETLSTLEQAYRDLEQWLQEQQEQAEDDEGDDGLPIGDPLDRPGSDDDDDQGGADQPIPGLDDDDDDGGELPGATGGAGGRDIPGLSDVARDVDDPTAAALRSQRPLVLSDELVNALRHGRSINTLAADGDDRFNEHLSIGEQMLRDRRYFDAENRFDRALQFRSNDPMALAGKANAQIGAGFHLSAALTLRRMMSRSPEMIDATYDPSLLPATERIDDAIRESQRRIQQASHVGSAGLLLAYLGRQLDKQNLVTQGLAAMHQHDPDDPLPPLLRSIWLDDDDDSDDAPEQDQSEQDKD